jgi:hypothetical protein
MINSGKTVAPSETPRPGRGAGGRFANGNPGGPGNPFAARVGKLRSTLLDVVSDAELSKVAAAMLKAAKRGDVNAARLLLSYAIGRPVDPVDGLSDGKLEVVIRYVDRPPTGAY